MPESDIIIRDISAKVRQDCEIIQLDVFAHSVELDYSRKSRKIRDFFQPVTNK